MIQLESKADGIIFTVRVQPGARRSGITGVHAGALKVAVSQPPERGRANAAAIKALCDALNLHPCQVELVAGQTSRQKRLLIRGLTTDELSKRIAEVLANSSA